MISLPQVGWHLLPYNELSAERDAIQTHAWGYVRIIGLLFDFATPVAWSSKDHFPAPNCPFTNDYVGRKWIWFLDNPQKKDEFPDDDNESCKEINESRKCLCVFIFFLIPFAFAGNSVHFNRDFEELIIQTLGREDITEQSSFNRWNRLAEIRRGDEKTNCPNLLRSEGERLSGTLQQLALVGFIPFSSVSKITLIEATGQSFDITKVPLALAPYRGQRIGQIMRVFGLAAVYGLPKFRRQYQVLPVNFDVWPVGRQGFSTFRV